MTLRNLAAASLAALALAACGDDNDNNTKPITPDTPATPEACKALKCTLQTEGEFKGSFVTKNDKGEITAVWDAKGTQTHKLGKDGKLHKIENKPEPGKTAGEFDLSGEGVNEPIVKETVHGGGIYMRGSKSRHDLKEAPQADLSPIGQFGLETDWDPSLRNIVIAKTLDEKGNVTSVIGVENVSFDTSDTNSNESKNTYGTVWEVDANKLPKSNGKIDSTKISQVQGGYPTVDMIVDSPAASEDAFKLTSSLPYKFDDTTNETWKFEEKDSQTTDWSGKVPVRLFGNNAWYEKNMNGGAKTYNMFRIADFKKVFNQTALKNGTGSGTSGVKEGQDLPTNVAFDTLNYVQFGRVTANVSDLKDADPAYNVSGLEIAAKANSASDGIVKGGDKSGTDFYFARGNNPTSPEGLKALPSNLIAYHGNALVFGLDDAFHGGKTADGESAHKSLPHSFGKDAVDNTKQTLLGGRGNFVYAQFDPAKSKVEGSVYNVWLIGTFKPVWVTSEWKYAQVDPNGGDDGFTTESTKITKPLSAKAHVRDVFPYKDDLIQFEGKVAGNSISGDAVNYADQKGKFAGAFFGKNAEEMSGVITSNTEAYGKPDATPHWGAVFGAKVVKGERGQVLPALGGNHTSWLHDDKRGTK